MSDRLFNHFVQLLHQKTGIALKDYKKYLVVNRLLKHVGPGKDFASFEDYYKALLADHRTNCSHNLSTR